MSKTKRAVHSDSKSLWNYTLSPGWTLEEVIVLRQALQKFGVGKWKSIIQSQCLPDKTIGQIYIQTQRLLGQQSLGEFMGLHLNLEQIWRENSLKKNATRKNGSVINTGDNPTREERKRRISENKAKFSITVEEISKIKLPRYHQDCLAAYFTIEDIEKSKFTTIEKMNHLMNLTLEIQRKMGQIKDEGLEPDVQKIMKLEVS